MVRNDLTIQDTADVEVIKNRIYEVRGLRVMLDRDLAELYGVETGVLNQAVRRNMLLCRICNPTQCTIRICNPHQLPEDFMFVMTEDEMNIWKSQIVMSNSNRMGMRRPPMVLLLCRICNPTQCTIRICNPHQLPILIRIARRGGNTARVAREAAEKEIGESIVSPLNAKQIAQREAILTIKDNEE